MQGDETGGRTGQYTLERDYSDLRAKAGPFRSASFQICKIQGKALLSSTHRTELQSCKRLFTTAQSCEFEGKAVLA